MNPIRIIDSHQHVWQLSRGDYGWLTPQLKPLYRDFLPHDIAPIFKELKIDGSILVQAAPTLAETKFLLDLAAQHDFILGVVGWVDMESSDAPDHIHKLANNSYFLGIRPMIQDIPDIDWMLKKEIAPSLKTLETLNLTFDALVLPPHLPNLIQLLKRYPHLKVVIDHGAKPFIKNAILEPWATEMKTLAEFPNVFCKLSGLVTEAGTTWSWNQLLPYFSHLFACFGSQRIMWGSDFPVLNLASDYHAWFQFCWDYVSVLGRDALKNVFGGTAEQFYQCRAIIS